MDIHHGWCYLTGMDGVIAVVDDPVTVPLQHSNKYVYRSIFQGTGQILDMYTLTMSTKHFAIPADELGRCRSKAQVSNLALGPAVGFPKPFGRISGRWVENVCRVLPGCELRLPPG